MSESLAGKNFRGFHGFWATIRESLFLRKILFTSPAEVHFRKIILHLPTPKKITICSNFSLNALKKLSVNGDQERKFFPAKFSKKDNHDSLFSRKSLTLR